jgi:hypothetical protein
LREVRRRSQIRPYPAQLPRSIDPVDKLGLQEELGAGDVKVYYLKGSVSYQTSKIKPDRSTIGDSKITIRPISRNQIEYQFGLSPMPTDSIVAPQKEILQEITESFGLGRAESFGISIKERTVLHEVSKLSKEIQNHSAIQGTDCLLHYETSSGDYSGVVARTLNLPRGFMRSIPRLIRNELVEHEIIRASNPLLGRIRSTLRTEWIIPEEKGWISLTDVMSQLHEDLTKYYWWQDVGIPRTIPLNIVSGGKLDMAVFPGGLISPLNAQTYQLLKRKYFVALQLPQRIL